MERLDLTRMDKAQHHEGASSDQKNHRGKYRWFNENISVHFDPMIILSRGSNS
jgi:hypothetical protein